MARVNHRKVKQLLNEKRSSITDRQFFTSRLLAMHYEDMAMAQTRRYKYNRRIHVNLAWAPKDRSVAYTDNLSVMINAGHKMITEVRSREDRYRLITGLFAHELGHCLYTDFLSAQTYDNYLQHYKWYPEPPELKLSSDFTNQKELWEYVKAEPRNLELLRHLAQHISNILEDGYVENRMLLQFPGKLGLCLEDIRNKQLGDMPTVTQLKEREDEGGHVFESVMQMMLSYIKFGTIKYGSEPLNDERIQLIFGLLPELDLALTNPSSKNRLRIVSLILVRCWEYVCDYLEFCKKNQEKAESSGTVVNVGQILSESIGSLVGNSAEGSGSSTPVAEATSSCTSSNTAEREQTLADAAQNDPSKSEPIERSGVSSKTASEDEQAEATEPGGMESSGKSEGKQTVSETEQGRLPHLQTERVCEPSGGTVEYNKSYERERYDEAASDIDRLLDKMAEHEACRDLENERVRELNDVAQAISYGDIHAGVNIRINRISEIDDNLVEQYNAVSAPLLTISKQLQKSVTQQLKDRRRGGKETGLLVGRRLDAHALCRNDGRVFYKNALPSETPEMAVALLLDESGSMCSCDRCTYARASAIILYDFCDALDIPVMVYGHSTDCTSVELYSYAEFESFDQNDKYRLMDISARGSNRDGAALRFVAEQLLKRPEEVKLLILVSDGQPAAPGYYGTAAEEDLRGIRQEYRRKGILFVAAAIGEDKQNIERIYGDSYMDITDLNQLPVKLTAMVKRHMKV